MIKKVVSKARYAKWLKTVDAVKSSNEDRVYGRCLCLSRVFFRQYTHCYDGLPFETLGWLFYPLA